MPRRFVTITSAGERTMLTVSEFNDVDRLPGLRSVWTDLWHETPGASFVQTLEWLEAYAHRLEAGRRLRVFSVAMRNEPIGILPLVVKPVETPWGTLRVLSSPLDEGDPGRGPVGRTRTATLVTVMRHLRNGRRDWDVIDLAARGPGDPTRSRLGNSMRIAGFRTHVRCGRCIPRVDLADGWSRYWNSRDVELRERCRRTEDGLAMAGDVVFARYRPLGAAYGDCDPVWAAFHAVETLFSPSGTVADRYRRDAHFPAVRQGAVDMSLLYVAGQPLAATYGYHRDGVVENCRIAVADGQPPEVGDLLLHRLLADGARRRDREYRFAVEDFERTAGWRTGAWRVWWQTHYAATAPRAQLWRLGRWLGAHSDRAEVGEVPAVEEVAPVAHRNHGSFAVVGE